MENSGENKKFELKIFKTLLDFDMEYSDEGLNRLAEELAGVFNSSECALFMYEREKKALRLLGYSSPDKTKVKVFKIRTNDFPEFAELRKGNLVRTDKKDLEEKDRIFDSEHLIFFPSSDNQELIGAIMFGYEDFSVIEENFLNLADVLKYIGKIVKLSIENRLMSEHVQKLLGLSRLSEVVNKADNFENLYSEALDLTCNMLNVEYGSIWLKNEADELEIKKVYGFEEEKVLRRNIPQDHGMVGWCYSNKEPFLSFTTKKDPRAAFDMLNIPIKSAIAVPLFHDKEVYGVIILINRKDRDLYRPYKHFDEIDLALLEDIAARGTSRLESSMRSRRMWSLMDFFGEWTSHTGSRG